MPLSGEQELLEHELRVQQMETNMRQMDINIKQMEANIAKIQRDARIESVKIAVSILGLAAAAFAAGHFTK